MLWRPGRPAPHAGTDRDGARDSVAGESPPNTSQSHPCWAAFRPASKRLAALRRSIGQEEYQTLTSAGAWSAAAPVPGAQTGVGSIAAASTTGGAVDVFTVAGGQENYQTLTSSWLGNIPVPN